jgi:RHS repeat-associated protein
MLYDGRGYLRQAHLTFTGSPEDIKITPAYSSEGLLMARTEERHWSGDTPGPDGEDSIWLVHNDETTHLFYVAGRPVAQLTDGALFYITTDHLGTPVLITNNVGTPVWAGGLEPFGRTWTAGDNPDPEPSSAPSHQDKAVLSRLPAENAFLRYPGQWASDAFRVGGVRMEVYYNVHRWYEVGVGRYGQPDPILFAHDLDAYRYAMQRPTNLFDRLGLQAERAVSTGTPEDNRCCGEAHRQNLFGLVSAGGIVICCSGRKVPCALEFRGGMSAAGTLAQKVWVQCTLAHEKVHVADLPECPPQCGGPVSLARFGDPFSRNLSECRGADIEIGCLEKSKPACGGDSVCIAALEARKQQALDLKRRSGC